MSTCRHRLSVFAFAISTRTGGDDRSYGTALSWFIVYIAARVQIRSRSAMLLARTRAGIQSPMLRPIPIPGLFITGTDTEVGKTVIAGAVADWFRRRRIRVGVCKPAGTGCKRVREGLVSEDAEFLAYCADAEAPLDIICPQRFAEPLAPAVAAERAGRPLDWEAIDRALREIAGQSDVLIVEGIGGLMVPMDRKFLVRDVIRWLGLAAVVVARPGLGTINHTLLTLGGLREAKIPIAGVVINRYPTDSASVAEETNLSMIEKWGKAPLLAVVPNEPFTPPNLPPGVVAAVERVDWERFARKE